MKDSNIFIFCAFTLQATWPRLHHHSQALARPLLRLIYDLASMQSLDKSDLRPDFCAKMARVCLRVLADLSSAAGSEDLSKSIATLKDLKLNERFSASLGRI